MWQPSTPLLEIVVRVALLYLALIALVRLAGKREIGQLSPLDLLAMLILSETVSPALRRHGALSPAEVRLAVVEPNGEITVLPKRS